MNDTGGEDFHFPEADEIAREVGMKKEKVNEIFRKLYPELISKVSDSPTVIRGVSCNLWIHLPWNDLKQYREKNKEHGGYLSGLSTFFPCVLPVIPRVGEEYDSTSSTTILVLTTGTLQMLDTKSTEMSKSS